MNNWFIGQIVNINVPTVVISIVVSTGFGVPIAMKIFDFLANNRLQKQTARANKELEAIKKECQKEIQAHYLQTQLKTTSLYSVYPELFAKMTHAYSECFIVYGPIRRQRPSLVTDEDKCINMLLEARNFFCLKSLFMPEQTEQLASEFFETASKLFADELSKTEVINMLDEQLKILKAQMRKELSGDARGHI